MRSTAIDRRTFLALGAGLLGAWPSVGAQEQAPDTPLFVGARLNGADYEVAVIDSTGRDRLVLPLGGRGHSFAIHSESGTCVAFARAPGRFALVFRPETGDAVHTIVPPEGRHFFGHGIFTPDGRLLLATENDFDAGRGVTGLYDASDGFRRIGEFATGGIGPHEILLMRDGKTVCIANGGILTHPDYPRQKLNLASMRSTLVYCDAETGEIVEEATLEPGLERLSVRHMTLDRRGDVWFGCQYEGDPADRPPLVGRHRRGAAIEFFAGPDAVLRQMRGYVGSVAADLSGDVLATSSPKGGCVVFWDTATGRFLGQRPIADGCGVAPRGRERVIATSGRGAILAAGPDGMRVLSPENPDAPAWDNHLRRL